MKAICIAASFIMLFTAACFSPRIVSPDAPVYFVQITDTHRGNPLHAERLKKAVDIINNLPVPVSAVIHTGDLACDNLAEPGVAEAISNDFSAVKAPMLFVPGNHDITKGRADLCAGAFTNSIGPLASELVTNGIAFLAVYSEPLRIGTNVSVTGFSPLVWLSSAVERNRGCPVFVFHHAPAHPDFYNNSFHDTWPEESKSAWNGILSRGHVIAEICGHLHRNELHWNDDGIPSYCAPAIADFWGRQGSIRLYRYSGGRLSYSTIYIED